MNFRNLTQKTLTFLCLSIQQSNPTLSRITTCCQGYERDPHILRKCNPICQTECVNGICYAPNDCICYPDHVKNLADFCVPTCPIGEYSLGIFELLFSIYSKWLHLRRRIGVWKGIRWFKKEITKLISDNEVPTIENFDQFDS